MTELEALADLPKTAPEPPGNEYGCCLRNTCPTREHGAISKVPPHCQTLKLISKFSPPEPPQQNECFFSIVSYIDS
jgi:hypothetical protein